MPTKIEWCDETWNPVTGCSPVSEGCLKCYAARMAKRLAGRCGYAKENPFQVTFHEDKLELPMKWKKPRKVFVCSMGDLFHDDVPFEWMRDIFRMMMFGPGTRHTYMILTKRPKRLMKWMLINYDPSTMHHFAEEHPNIWLGVTAENQARADERIPILLSIPAAIHFVSVEPMLESVSLAYAAFNGADSYSKMVGIDWVIAGPETGPGARECRKEWLEDLAWQCEVAGVPFFDKRKTGWTRREWPKQQP